jgi:hypothetical protein
MHPKAASPARDTHHTTCLRQVWQRARRQALRAARWRSLVKVAAAALPPGCDWRECSGTGAALGTCRPVVSLGRRAVGTACDASRWSNACVLQACDRAVGQ